MAQEEQGERVREKDYELLKIAFEFVQKYTMPDHFGLTFDNSYHIPKIHFTACIRSIGIDYACPWRYDHALSKYLMQDLEKIEKREHWWLVDFQEALARASLQTILDYDYALTMKCFTQSVDLNVDSKLFSQGPRSTL